MSIGAIYDDGYSNSGGYTCPNCGLWVPPGTWHSCCYEPSYTYIYGISTKEGRIARALERVADALEKLSR
jgi:hypothetical protein